MHLGDILRKAMQPWHEPVPESTLKIVRAGISKLKLPDHFEDHFNELWQSQLELAYWKGRRSAFEEMKAKLPK